ncbi:2-oxo-4-hydroxy-4-carboxy-5-ureidoimidazoline decarboxylase [Nocardia amikacinitolerans]|uniref:2-oxo-4-hydroxy-4-carboxy-5-ureidoimidazoline decarboxylase n=1 Tax=Nocardia amikacinitolerans TaxID=756689 RepID=UPI0020A3B080|nr:2-oxo-4-hydroxy-4-carboxy-5-ureidoimidazoline decarboxylase [Nocardia amikacinitolerans]MCP2277509.1 2-oxo-4-hydroxy-4-carboxy-5-ureidoimidazoline decarboxylase [Nocardia amikacinitolerans]
MTDEPAGITEFDALSNAAAADALLACCASPAWVGGMLAGRPYRSAARLYETADAVLAALPEDEIDRALAGHPRIGERTDNTTSAREQSGVAEATDAVRAALAEGNRAYEQRFGHRYLVCATGRSGSELLDLLTTRLRNDPATERAVMRTELAKINRIRLRRMLGESA